MEGGVLEEIPIYIIVSFNHSDRLLLKRIQ